MSRKRRENGKFMGEREKVWGNGLVAEESVAISRSQFPCLGDDPFYQAWY